MRNIVFTIIGLFVCGLSFAQTAVVDFPMELSGNNIAETVSGSTFEVNHALPVYDIDGARGRCIHFDGYSNYVKDATILTNGISNQDITFSVWVAPLMWPLMNQDVDSEDWMTLCGNLDDDAKTGFAFFLSNRGHYSFECWTSEGKIKAVSSDKLLPCYQWSHLVGTIHCSATTRADRHLTLYNNGEEIASAIVPSSFLVGGSSFLIGKSANDVKADNFLLNSFNGLIDDITIYNGVQQSVINDNTPEKSPDLTYNAAKRYTDNILRPHFHGAPDGGWSNETHGLVFYNSRYHLFYQKNPSLSGINNQKWGHISSENLYDWREEKLALMPSEWYDKKGCWSGCVFENEAFNGGKPTILYTGVDYARAMIAMASPLDNDLKDWQKSSSNPIINGVPSGFSGDFRDCYFFENNGEKYIIVGCSKNNIGCATLHKFVNGSWTNDGSVFFQGTNANTCGTMWEMPNITPMDNGKWLFTVTPLGMGDGVKCIYWIGTIGTDGTFTPQQTEPQSLEMTGTSKQGYGLLSPSIYQKDGKTLMLGIVPDKVGSDYQYNWGWAHCYALPREVSLSSDGTTLLQKPYSGLEAMRVSDGACNGANVVVNNNAVSLGDVSGRQVELVAEFPITSGNNTARTGFRVLKNGASYASIYYSSNTVSVDLSNLDRINNDNGVYADGTYTGSFYNERVRPGSTVKLHVFLDGSILDVFVNDHYAFSTRVYPTDSDGIQVEAFSTANTTFTMLQGWKLDPKSDTNGIEAVSCMPQTANDRVFDLWGRQLASIPNHGFYICGGKKYIK